MKSRLRLLDLFCGAGGASMGYHQAGFEVTGVDIRPQPHYPFPFIQSDVFCLPRDFLQSFDVIHASPPCQRFSVLTPISHKLKHPDLILKTRNLLQASGKPYIIENVRRAPLKACLMLCGSMFGLPVIRHRYFEIFPPLPVLTPPCSHSPHPVLVSGSARHGNKYVEYPVSVKRSAMQIDWMTGKELDEAIPPAYTRFIAIHILQRGEWP